MGKPFQVPLGPRKGFFVNQAYNGKRFKRVKYLKYTPDAPEPVKAFDPLQPARFKNAFRDYPALQKWIIRYQPAKKEVLPEPALNREYLGLFGDTMVPLERTSTDRMGESTFDRFEAKFKVLLHEVSVKGYRSEGQRYRPEEQIYLAQHSLSDLPKQMQEDCPTPELIKHLGKGDIYASSLWMGKAPTVTPLHRDPNPNLFVQLNGKKMVRLFTPDVGRQMYEEVRAKLGQDGGNASMRGEEMMQGGEKKALESAVWDKFNRDFEEVKGQEIMLTSSDALYIPQGWWHAVRGMGTGPNVSVSHHHFHTIRHDANSFPAQLVVPLKHTTSTPHFTT